MAPDKYALYFATLVENGTLEVKEVLYPALENAIGEEFKSTKKPDLSLFSDSELKILATVKEYFNDCNAKRITDFSHDEKGYKETEQGQIIPYEYAVELKI